MRPLLTDPRWWLLTCTALVSACSGAQKTDLELPAPAGADVDASAGPGAEAGAGACPKEITEVEPNDTPRTANVIGAAICGSVRPGSDADHFKLELGKKTMQLSFSYMGSVRIVVSVGADRIELTSANPPPVPLRKNLPYIFEVTSPDGQPHDYKITVVEGL